MYCIKCNVLLQLMPATVTEPAALAAATEAAATEAAVTDSSTWWQHNKMWGRSGACFLLDVKASSNSNQLMMCAFLASLLPIFHYVACSFVLNCTVCCMYSLCISHQVLRCLTNQSLT